MKQIAFLMVSLFFVLGVPFADAGVNVGVSIGVPSPYEFAEPPDVVVIPSETAYVYMMPGIRGLYFYNGLWYRFHRGHWFTSIGYNGSWAYIDTPRVPRVILDVPPDYYRNLPPGYYRIRYGDFNRHWREWEQVRHWNTYDWYKNEHERRGHDRGRDLHDSGSGRHDDGHKHPDDRKDMEHYR